MCGGFNEETVNEIKRSRAVQTVVTHVSRFEFDLKVKESVQSIESELLTLCLSWIGLDALGITGRMRETLEATGPVSRVSKKHS